MIASLQNMINKPLKRLGEYFDTLRSSFICKKIGVGAYQKNAPDQSPPDRL
jgi:hypothetical protein